MPGLLSTLLGTQQKVQFIQTDTGTVLSIDCTVSESHDRESPPTEFEVEDGSTVSDHILVKPFSLKIEGVISDTPIKLLNSALTTAAGVALPSVGIVAAGAGVALFKALASSASPSVAAYGQLLLLQEGKKPFDVLTTLKRYSGMFIKSISVPRDANTGQTLMFTVMLTELRLVKPQTVNILQFKDADISAGKGNIGKQESESALLKKFQQGQAAFRNVIGGG